MAVLVGDIFVVPCSLGYHSVSFVAGATWVGNDKDLGVRNNRTLHGSFHTVGQRHADTALNMQNEPSFRIARPTSKACRYHMQLLGRKDHLGTPCSRPSPTSLVQ